MQNGDDKETRASDNALKVLGINFGVMAVYTLLSALFHQGFSGAFGDTVGLLGFSHAALCALGFVFCLLIGRFTISGAFLLSGVGILVIGLSICNYAYSRNMERNEVDQYYRENKIEGDSPINQLPPWPDTPDTTQR